MSKSKYTKAQLEELVALQLENLNAMHDLMRIMKFQNELLENANKKLCSEILPDKRMPVRYSIKSKK